MTRVGIQHNEIASRARALRDGIIQRLGKVECSCSPDLATELVIEPCATKEEVLAALEGLEAEKKVRRVDPQPTVARTRFHVVFELV